MTVQLLDPGQTLIGPPRLPGLAPLRLDGFIKLAPGMRPAAVPVKTMPSRSPNWR